MAELNNHLDVYRILPQTNCRKCNLPTCLAFAVAVIQGNKKLDDCPDIDQEAAAGNHVAGDNQNDREQEIAQLLQERRERIQEMDLAAVADKLGAKYSNGRLSIPCLSKYFGVDQNGVVYSDCHVNNWVVGPLLNYVINCQGVEAAGEWVPLRDLPGGQDWGRFFEHRCEIPFKKLVDQYTNLFEDIIDIFDGQPAPDSFDSDIAVIIRPLPRLPVLICYWKPEDGLGSSSHMFFDAKAEKNLNIESIYTLCVGLVTMFEKIARTHGI